MKVGYQVLVDLQQQQAFKQWGYQTVHGTNPVTYDLPIPFEEAPFTVAISTGNSGNHASCGGFTKTTIVLRAGTTAGVWDTVGFFIIGCQLQWGYQKQLTVEPVVYPLPVNTVCCVWAHSIHDRQDPGTYHSILSKITPVGVQILAGQYNAPATAYSGVSAYWGMIGC